MTARYASCKGKGLSQALLAIGRISVIKNKSAISELPEFFENECSQIAALVGRFHDYALEMRKDIVAIATQNKVRASLSSSLKGVQDILAKEESMIGSPIVFDVEKENRICEQLQLAGVGCYQALISVGSEILITLLVKRDTVDKEAIEKSVSEVVGRCKITKCDDSVIKGVAVVELAQKPAFNAICGVARVGKTENATGDAHAFVKLSEGKYMCALCDGMGSGERAGEISDKAITLIEDFYRAGFDHALTVKSVNKFLKVDGDESFSALDVMVFDAKEGVVDVVKMASPPSFVKKRDRTIKISSSSLPLGIVGEITPSVSTRSVDDGDCYVFVSDGVYDCFKNDELSAFINNEDARNPQRLCDKILQKAQSVQSERRDDMTVIACMVFFDNY